MRSSSAAAGRPDVHAPLGLTYRTRWCSLTELAVLADPWRALAAAAVEPNVFYEPCFALAAAPVFGRDAGAVLVWTQAGRLAGLFPMQRRGRPAMAAMWTHPYAPLGVPLVWRDDPEGAIGAWLDAMSGMQDMPAVGLIPFLPERGPFAAALGRVLERRGLRREALGAHARALLAPGTNRHDYLGRTMSSGRRKELRRQRRRLEEIAPVEFSAVAAGHTGAAIEDFLVLEASGWKGVAGTAAAADPQVRAFFESAVRALGAEGKAEIHRLTLSGRAIAAAVVLFSGDTAWFWKVAYSEGVARSSPGAQLAVDLTQALLSEPEIARTDSCATADHPMIDPIWGERLHLSDLMIEICPSGLAFAAAHLAEKLRRTARTQAKRLRDRLRPRRSRAVAQQPADHLAGGGHGHFVDKSDLARIFVRGEPRPYETLDVGRQRL